MILSESYTESNWIKEDEIIQHNIDRFTSRSYSKISYFILEKIIKDIIIANETEGIRIKSKSAFCRYSLMYYLLLFTKSSKNRKCKLHFSYLYIFFLIFHFLGTQCAFMELAPCLASRLTTTLVI